MKDSRNLQHKLYLILKSKQDFRAFCQWPWNDLEFRELALMVKAYAEANDDVINDDPLLEWLEEYHFFIAEGGG